MQWSRDMRAGRSALGRFVRGTLLAAAAAAVGAGCGRGDPAPVRPGARTDSSGRPATERVLSARDIERQNALLDELLRGFRGAGSLQYRPSYQYATEPSFSSYGFGGQTTYSCSAWDLHVVLSNACSVAVELGDTLMVFEESSDGNTYLAGAMEHDGDLDAEHVWRLSDRYSLDGYIRVDRAGKSRGHPLVGGSKTVFTATETGEPIDVLLLKQITESPAYEGYGFGTIPAAATATVSQTILMGTGFKNAFLKRVSVVTPSVHLRKDGIAAAGRLLLRFAPETPPVASVTGSVDRAGEAEARPPVKLVGVELIPMRYDELAAIAGDGNRGLAERVIAINWLGELRDPRSQPLFAEWLRARVLPVLMRRACAWNLSRFKDPAAHAALLEVLSDTSAPAFLRGECALALAEAGDKAAVVPLLSALQDPNTPPLPSLYTAARLLGDPRLGPVLAGLLTRSSHTNCHNDVAFSLSTTMSEEAVAPLLTAARCELKDVRSKALHYLGASRSPRAVSALAALAADPAYEARVGAALALGLARSPESFQALAVLLENPACTSVHYQAVEALKVPEKQNSVGIARLFGARSAGAKPEPNEPAVDRSPATAALVKYARTVTGKDRVHAVEALLRNPPSADALLLVLELLRENATPDEIKAACLVVKDWKLTQARDSLLRLAAQGTPEVAFPALTTLVEACGGADEGLVRSALNRTDTNNVPCEPLLKALVARKPQWLGGLLSELAADSRRRVVALETAAALGPEAAFLADAAAANASSTNWNTQRAAVAAACALASPRMAVLYETISTNASLAVDQKVLGMKALAKVAPDRGRAVARSCLTNRNSYVRGPAAAILAEIGEPADLPAVRDYLLGIGESELVELAEPMARARKPELTALLEREAGVCAYDEANRERIRSALRSAVVK